MAFPYSEGMHQRGVKYIQEWLCLRHHGVLIDGRFGAATTYAAAEFQREHGLPVTGVVDMNTWEALIEPMTIARRSINAAGQPLSALTLAHAEVHLGQHAREVGYKNCGPWVREYMFGKDGEDRKWCAGFATYCLAQAARSTGRPLPLRRQISVPKLVAHAKKARLFLPNPRGAQRSLLTPGSLFVTRGGRFGWNHVGIVSGVHGDVFTTIEGNSSDVMQTYSFEVCRRIRSFESATKDFIVFPAS